MRRDVRTTLDVLRNHVGLTGSKKWSVITASAALARCLSTPDAPWYV